MALKPGNGGAQRGNGERDPRLDLLYRDAARETPPAHLDAAILAAARREVGARPRGLASPLRRWRVPVSIAAIVVLSASLVTLVREEGGESLLRDAREPAAPPAARIEESPQQPAKPAEAPEVRERRQPAAPEQLHLRRDEAVANAPAEPRVGVEAERARSALQAAPAPDSAALPQVGAVDGALSSRARESPQRPEVDAPSPGASPSGVRGLDAAPPAAAPQPKPAERRKQAEQVLATKGPPAWHGLEQEPPEKWVERLAELRRQGRTGEADELLTELKRRFPGHPLPSGLK